ncbi:MAG: response regulator transcription factor [Anaerolineae bacterium]|nr:response regulator transcription factor [Anaerolineae bacterium]
MTASQAHHPSMVTAKITVLIVDNLPHVRQSLRTLLQLTEELEIVGEAANGREAVQLAEQVRPDIVIMDLKMPEMDGFEATRQIKERHLAKRVIALTLYGNQHHRERAAQVGVDAFAEKGTAIDTLVEVIQEIYQTK